MSFYYSAQRARPLDDDERAKIGEIRAAYSVRAQIEDFHRTGHGWNGEDFDVRIGKHPDDPLVCGSIQLPTAEQSMLVGPDAEFYNAVLHWSEAVTSLRRTIRDATWDVSVSGENIPWNAQAHAFTPPVPDDARARRAHRSRWEGAVVGAPDERMRAYAPEATFAVGDLVTHSTFGRGVVERHVGPTKIEILFREGPRLLTHAVPGAPTSPTVPRDLDLENFPSGDDPF